MSLYPGTTTIPPGCWPVVLLTPVHPTAILSISGIRINDLTKPFFLSSSLPVTERPKHAHSILNSLYISSS